MSGVILYKNEPYLFEEKLEKIDFTKAKQYRVGGLVLLKYLFVYTFKLPSNIQEDQLALQVELKMYQEGGLDPNIEYVIDFVSYKLEYEESYLVEAFAIKQEDLKSLFGEVARKIGFIDTIFPRFIAYKVLYSKELSLEENHLFLHLSEEEAFAAIYQNGRYIGYRQIDSLSNMAKNLGYELSFLKETLIRKGIKQEHYSPEEMHIYTAISELLYKNIERVVYAVNFKRSYFGLDQIDRIIIDFEGESIEGLQELFLSFGVEGDYIYQRLSCCDVGEREASLALLALYVSEEKELDQKLNFSIFERKPPLYKLKVFQYTMAFLVLLLLIGASWGYLFYKDQELGKSLKVLNVKLSALQKRNKKYLNFIKKFKSEKEGLQKQKSQLQKEVEVYEETLDAIPLINDIKQDRQKMINDLVEALYLYKLSTKSIEQNSTKSVIVDIVSENDEREKIAKFMEYLLQKGYKSVETDKIVRSKNFYESIIKVRR